MNFVSFCDFYALSLPTTFQIGKLFIDGRSCHLCLRVEDIAAHAAQAQLSHLCLAYCECTRDGSTQKMNIVAAITAGDARLLIPGRHGIFMDTDGVSWEAVLVKLVDNPISIRTAMFAPYRRIGRMVTDQIEKFTDAKSAAIVSDASKSLEKLATEGKARPFDIGRSMGRVPPARGERRTKAFTFRIVGQGAPAQRSFDRPFPGQGGAACHGRAALAKTAFSPA